MHHQMAAAVLNFKLPLILVRPHRVPQVVSAVQVRQRLGQRRDGELLLVAQDRAHSSQNLSNQGNVAGCPECRVIKRGEILFGRAAYRLCTKLFVPPWPGR
jgi:hypothetical protein